MELGIGLSRLQSGECEQLFHQFGHLFCLLQNDPGCPDRIKNPGMDTFRTALNSHHRRFQLVRHILEKPFLGFVRLFNIAAELPAKETDQHAEHCQHREKNCIQISRILHNCSDIHIQDVRICVLIFIGFDL